MLKELMTNTPINQNFTQQELDATLTQDFIVLIREKISIDLTKNASVLTSIEMEKIISTVKVAYQKIFDCVVVAPDAKIFIANYLMCKLFDLWKISSTPELFFIKIRQNFTPAQIVAALELFISIPKKQTWVLNFFYEHKEIFPKKNKKIHTIGIYFREMYNGGTQKFLSIIIPTYIKLGYRIILFNDIYKPEQDYSLPVTSQFFERIILTKLHGSFLEKLSELEKYLEKYDVDLFMFEAWWDFGYLASKVLFPKLCGIKILWEMHTYINKHVFELNNSLSTYILADAIVSLSRIRQNFFSNFGVRSYYIPNPVYVDGAESFHGRDAKKCSNTILYVGRIAAADDKNTFAILPIFREVVKVIPNAKLKIVGEVYKGGVSAQMKKFIAENNLESNVEFCGYHKDVGKFYEEADLILSTSPSEGWGLFIVESKFYELPLVLYELPDVETLRDGKGYIAVPQGDFRAAARAIVKILTDTEFRCKLSAEARESLQPFIDYDIAGAWQKVFDDLDNNTPIPPHNINAEKIQKLLLKEIWQEKFKSQVLTAQVNFLATQLQQKK